MPQDSMRDILQIINEEFERLAYFGGQGKTIEEKVEHVNQSRQIAKRHIAAYIDATADKIIRLLNDDDFVIPSKTV